MAVYDDLQDNRPPPKARRSIRLTTPGIPWYRDLRILRIIAQIVFAVVFFGGLFIAFYSLNSNLEGSPLAIDFSVYSRPLNVAISEGIPATGEWAWISNTDIVQRNIVVLLLGLGVVAGLFAFRQYRLNEKVKLFPAILVPALLLLILIFVAVGAAENVSQFLQDYLYGGSVVRAFITGIYNTLRVVVLSLIACTILGVLAGIGLLSKNFLVRGVCKFYVEVFRNTPLLVQLIFIYRSFTLLLPGPRNSHYSPSEIGPLKLEENLYALNARGLYLIALENTDTALFFTIAVIIGLVAVFGIRRWRLRVQEETGAPTQLLKYALPPFLGIVLLGWLIAGGWPLSGGPYTVNYPELVGPNIRGGTQLSVAFISLFLGLTLYTAAFIADIVRAGIQSVSYGQIEAARSQGLRGNQVLSLVILPQALRLIIPPLGNQYINLGKNSSLAVAVTYVDTFRVAQLANNESGQAIPFFVGLMVIYLTLSLVLSLLTNMFNQSTRIKTR